MNILVINGSPKGEKSDTFKLTEAFLRGMGENAEIIDTYKAHINPCLGCYACWHETPGICVQKDGTAAILEKITAADVLIWSTPLYCYSFPANCKALIDRLLPLSCPDICTDENGQSHHSGRNERHDRSILISGCGFPDRDGNYDALQFQFRRLFGSDCPMILCTEAPLLSVPAAMELAEKYLTVVETAGREFRNTGCIPENIQTVLDMPMLDPYEYRKNVNAR